MGLIGISLLCNMAISWATGNVRDKIGLEITLVLLDFVSFVAMQVDSIFI